MQSDEEATAYEKVLARDPEHFDTLMALGIVLSQRGELSKARQLFQRAVVVRPNDSQVHTNLALTLSQNDELGAARAEYEMALKLDPKNEYAHRGIAVVLLRLGEHAAAARHVRLGYSGVVHGAPYQGKDRPRRLLVLRSALGQNVPIEQFIDNQVFLESVIIAEYFERSLPDHDVVFNAIGEADYCREGLLVAERLLSSVRKPILNHPAKVKQSGRVANAYRLRQLPGVSTAHAAFWPRTELLKANAASALSQAGFSWPLLLRRPGFHNGEHFIKVDRAEELGEASAAIGGQELLVLQFLDTRSGDGQYRKYRAMFIDGQIYPLHLAISSRWKVHYKSADMADHAAYRAEDEAFLNNMSQVLGSDAMAALARVQTTLGLDYGGVDFTIDASGQLVVFEANATMVIVPPGKGEQWAYRQAPVRRAQAAMRQMLLQRATSLTA